MSNNNGHNQMKVPNFSYTTHNIELTIWQISTIQYHLERAENEYPDELMSQDLDEIFERLGRTKNK